MDNFFFYICVYTAIFLQAEQGGSKIGSLIFNKRNINKKAFYLYLFFFLIFHRIFDISFKL